jgi:excisionase family DNA binding protein
MSNRDAALSEVVGVGPPAQNASPAEDSQVVRLLSPTEVAAMCGLSRRAVYDAIKRGELRAFKLCSRLRISTADVDAWLVASLVAVTQLPVVPPPRGRSIESAPAGSFRARLQDWWTLHAEPQLAKVMLELYAMLWDVHIFPAWETSCCGISRPKRDPRSARRGCTRFVPARGSGPPDFQSGRADSNRRPPAPKAGALTRLRHAPYCLVKPKTLAGLGRDCAGYT